MRTLKRSNILNSSQAKVNGTAPASSLRLGQFLGLRQVLKAVEAEKLEEAFGGAVEDRAPGFFGAAGDFDEVLFHQRAYRLAARDATDRLDIGAEDRLLVGNDRQRFQRRLG